MTQEEEANIFATALLMPEELVVVELRAVEAQVHDWDAVVEEMAKRFGVSVPRMAARLQEILDRRRSRA